MQYLYVLSSAMDHNKKSYSIEFEMKKIKSSCLFSNI